MPPDDHNPFASPAAPQLVEGPPDDFRALRDKTNWRWRISLLILLVPAGVNYVLFDQMIRAEMYGTPFWFAAMRLIDGVQLLCIVAFCWFLGLSLLEWIARAIRYVFARSVPRPLWLESMYRSLSHMVPVAILANTLWMIWLVGYYLLKMNFFVISIPVGIVAHLLGATLYVRIFYNWYRLVRESRVADSQATITQESP